MRADLQNQIAPPTVSNTELMSDAKIKKVGNAVDSTGPQEKADFRDVLFNSNVDVKKEREARANGDLTAETQEEFLEKLAEQTKEKRVPKNKLDKDDFLKLFVTQLKNQDPMNPDDGAEMAAKLAQFNSLEQLMNVNKSLEKMATAESTNRSMMLSGFIGKEIQVDGGRTRLADDLTTDSKFEIARGAKNATLQVRDTSGTLIKEQDLGSLTPGQHKLEWDGTNRSGDKAPNGIYTYAIMALDSEGKDIPVSLSSSVKVMGVDIGDGEGSFFTDYGKIPVAKVKAVGEQGFYQYERNVVKDAIKGAEQNAGKAGATAAQILEPKRPLPVANLNNETSKDSKTQAVSGATAKDEKSEGIAKPETAEGIPAAVKKDAETAEVPVENKTVESSTTTS